MSDSHKGLVSRRYKFFIQFILSFTLLFIGLKTYASAITGVSPVCSERFSGNEHYLSICEEYSATEIQVLEGVFDLSEKVAEAAGHTLFIVTGSQVLLNSPVKMQAGQGVLPDNSSAFLELLPANSFSSEGDPLFCLLKMGEGGNIGGLKSDATLFSDVPDFKDSLQNPEKPVTLIYTHGVSNFHSVYLDLKGTSDMDYLFWANNDIDSDGRIGGTHHEIQHSYLDGNGVATTVSLELPAVADSADKEFVLLTNNVITTGGEASDSIVRKALSVKNGCGVIERNHLAFRRADGLAESIVRQLLYLENVDGTTVKQNQFYSEQPELREADQLLHLHRSTVVSLSASFEDNSGTGRGTTTAGNVDKVAGLFIDNYRTLDLPVLVSSDDFFRLSGKAGICYVDRYALQNVSASAEAANTTDLTGYCDQSLNTWINFSIPAVICDKSICTDNTVSYAFNGVQGLVGLVMAGVIAGQCYFGCRKDGFSFRQLK